MDPILGQIQAFGFNFAPRGWAKCDGQLLSISANTALFSLLGTTYGGDGRTTFALPDLRSRSGVHQGNGAGLDNISIGQRGGSIQHTLTVGELPNHNHSLNVSSANASQTAASANSSIATPGSTVGRVFTPTEGFNTATPDVTLNSASVSPNGGNQPFNIRNPFLGINYCIALVGVFPSRS